jgi:Ca2+-binding EF-hand superfamily protein
MFKVNERAAMRKRIEEQNLTHIANYITKRPGMTLEKLFKQFDSNYDNFIDIEELTTLFKELQVPMNNQLIRIVLGIFDHSKD